MRYPILYCNDTSPPCRAVLLAGKAIGIKFEIRSVKVFEGETMSTEFLQMNPQHTIPTLNDNGFIIWDSHAIMCYLSDMYGTSQQIYPRNLLARTSVHQHLYFDNGVLYSYLDALSYNVLTDQNIIVNADIIESIRKAYDFLQNFLEGKKWLLGNDYTLADMSCVSTLSSLSVFYSYAMYPRIVRWIKTCEEELPGYSEVNAPGNEKFHDMFKPLLPKF